MRRYLTPPEYARELGAANETVLGLIKSGRLKAFTTSPPGSKRPRWKIPLAAIQEFERANQPEKPKPIVRRGRRNTPEFIEFV